MDEQKAAWFESDVCLYRVIYYYTTYNRNRTLLVTKFSLMRLHHQIPSNCVCKNSACIHSFRSIFQNHNPELLNMLNSICSRTGSRHPCGRPEWAAGSPVPVNLLCAEQPSVATSLRSHRFTSPRAGVSGSSSVPTLMVRACSSFFFHPENVYICVHTHTHTHTHTAYLGFFTAPF